MHFLHKTLYQYTIWEKLEADLQGTGIVRSVENFYYGTLLDISQGRSLHPVANSDTLVEECLDGVNVILILNGNS